MAIDRDEYNRRRRERYSNNKEKMREQSKLYREKNPNANKKAWENHQFGGNKQLVLQRDNFECQDCGMIQEKHIVLFNTQLIVHHIDGKGRRSEEKNNDIDNLITLCVRCHAKLHRYYEKKRRLSKRSGTSEVEQ